MARLRWDKTAIGRRIRDQGTTKIEERPIADEARSVTQRIFYEDAYSGKPSEPVRPLDFSPELGKQRRNKCKKGGAQVPTRATRTSGRIQVWIAPEQSPEEARAAHRGKMERRIAEHEKAIADLERAISKHRSEIARLRANAEKFASAPEPKTRLTTGSGR